jgi:TPP-dependent pyruvate/acetoin dehydrogenase alpha subunit
MDKEGSSNRSGGRPASPSAVDQGLVREMFRKAYTIRRFETRCVELYREGFIRGYFHPYLGEEAIAVGACSAIEPDDYIVSTHRGHGHCIAKNGNLRSMMAEIMGRATGYCRGRGGSMHIASLDDNNLGANGIVGGGIPIATGAGFAIKVKKGNQVVLSFFSDGAANNGVFGESVNLAAIFDLPVIFVLENNHYAVSTPVEYACRLDNLARRADGYGFPGVSVDGNDAVSMYLETQKAVARARKGEGPTLIEAKTYRHGGHHVNDPGLYMDQKVMARWKERDPVNLLRERITDKGKVKEIEEAVEKALADAVEFGKDSPSPSVEEFLKYIETY